MLNLDRHIDEYEKLTPELEECAALYVSYLKEKLDDLNIHLVYGRVKKPESVRKKLERYNAEGNPQRDITDKIGLRVITFYSDDIKEVSTRIREIFNVDHDNSIDKSSVQNTESFWYKSVHWIVKFKESELRKINRDTCRRYWVEIQVRTVMQHAWAEMEHSIGYKSKYSTPPNLKRKFARLSSLIEIADEGFSNIRIESQRMTTGETPDVLFSAEELENFVVSDPVMQNIKENIVSEKCAFFTEYAVDNLNNYFELCQLFGMYELTILKENLQKHQTQIIEQARETLPENGAARRPTALPLSYPLNMLFELLL